MSDRIYRVGIIGGGRKGTAHGRCYHLNPRTEVVAIADTDPENRQIFARRFGVAAYEDYREMIGAEDVEIAAPILPVGPNPEVVVGCAAMPGVKGILCEKPLAASLEEADRTVGACASRGIAFGAGDLDRNLPGFQKVKAHIDSGALGALRSITFFGGSGTELSGGGCQILSLMRMFAGDVDAQFAVGWVDNPESDHDQGGAGYVRFVNGVEALIHREEDGRGRGFVAACESGVVRYDNFVLSVWRVPDDARDGDDLERVDGVVAPVHVYGGFDRGYDAEDWKWPGDRNAASVQAIVDAIDDGRDPPGSGDNGCKVLELAIALRESHRQGHGALSLPLADRTLRMIPHPSRMENKKPIFGTEKYMEQLGSHTRKGVGSG